MKKIIISILLIGFTNLCFAQSGLTSKISEVTVFKKNAAITRTLETKLKPGTQEVILTDISLSINPHSLQVQLAGNNATLLSAKYEQNYLQKRVTSKETEALMQQLEDLTLEIDWINDQKQILNGMEEVWNKNQDLGGRTNAFTPEQVLQLSNAYKTKFLEIRKEKQKLSTELKALTKEKTKIQNQLNEQKASFNKPNGNIVLKIDAKTTQNTKIKCIYTVNNAGWLPLYDLRSEGITENVKLNYKANVYQNTGYDWSNVKMKISTGNPTQNNNRPILNPLFAQFYTANYGYIQRQNANLNLATTNAPVGASYDITIREDESNKKDKYKNGFAYNANTVTNQINITFEIKSKQSLKSDGKQNLIGLESYDLETEYTYHTVPKLDKSAFLIAKISNWGKHYLETGEANIFFEGAYIGKTTINPQVTSDNLLISMGRDNGITVERKPIKNFKTSKFIGTNKKEIIGYDIIVKNKKNMPINIEILDQIPVSQNKLIEVELQEKSGADYNKEIGKLLWKLELQPQESTKKRFVYSVKYPKKQNVTGIL